VDGPVQELDISRVANVAAARLASGGYLLLVNYSSNANNYRLYYTNSLDDPRIEPLWQNEVETTWDTGWTSGEGGFENISLVSECGSNRLFMIGATGKGVYKIAANGKWSLFEVLPGAPVLSHITNNTRHMYAPECDTRATGTAFAGPKGELALYCHQKLQDANARKDLVKCGLSVAFGLFGGPAEYFCGEAVVADTKLRFTEYWPTLGTPESTPVTMRKITVKLTGMGIYTEGMSLGVLEGNMGSTCISDSGSNMTCTWKVPSNTAMTLIPMFDETYDSVQWHGTTCSSRNNKAPGNRPAECSFTVGQDLTIELSGAEVI
jgi:hypothetical protein